jgi:hypothetical protein
VKEWRVDTAHSRHPMSGCHTNTDQIIQGAQGDFLFSALITKRGLAYSANLTRE